MENISKYIEELRANPNVREKDLGNNISSFNFTKKAFKKGLWDKQTIKSRGLFIDVEENKIIARSFDKFFEERGKNGKTVEELQYPVTLFKKENGFLGIASGGKDGSELFIASKSTNQGVFRDMFSEILEAKIGSSMMSAMANYLYRSNLSAVFEVIDPERDPHIVEYHKPHLVLLALVENEIEFKQRPYAEVKWFADLIRVKPKQKVYTATTSNALCDYLVANLSQVDFEGFVMEDASGYMLKWKSPWYKIWKRYRSVLGNPYKPVEYWVDRGLDRSMVELIYDWGNHNQYGNIIDFRNWYKAQLDK